MLDTSVTSRRHPVVRRLRDAARGDMDIVLLEGPHLLAEALASCVPLTLVAATHAAAARVEVAASLCEAHRQQIEIVYLSESALEAASPARTPVGVLALTRLPLSSIDALVQPAPALVTVAIGVQDPGNLGSLLRSTEAAGGTGCVVTAGCAHPHGWKTLRGSMGSALRLPIARHADAAEALDLLRARGLRIVATAADATTTLYDADLTGPCAVCVGAEGLGLDEALLERADDRIAIPMDAPVESLNVAVAASLVLFEARRQREARR